MYERIEVLDHGYLQLVEHYGSDERIIEAARMSTAKGFLGWGPRCRSCGIELGGDSNWISCPSCGGDEPVVPGDEKLLRYLWVNQHSTPFEMAGAIIEVQAPILVFREWHRHRVPFGYSERSARYTPLPDFSYVPTVDRMLLNSKTNKQAGTIKDADELTPEIAAALIEEEIAFNAAAERFYQKKLKAGVPKELARTHVGVSRYSCMRATGNLRGWLAFLTLRQAPNAQFEIREYANALASMLRGLFPRTMELFDAGRR